MRAPMRLAAAAALALAAMTAVSGPADAAQSVRTFANCTAVHRVYSGGIAKNGVQYNTVHSHGRTYHRALKGDGIACEKS
jgi:cytochrome c2